MLPPEGLHLLADVLPHVDLQRVLRPADRDGDPGNRDNPLRGSTAGHLLDKPLHRRGRNGVLLHEDAHRVRDVLPRVERQLQLLVAEANGKLGHWHDAGVLEALGEPSLERCGHRRVQAHVLTELSRGLRGRLVLEDGQRELLVANSDGQRGHGELAISHQLGAHLAQNLRSVLARDTIRLRELGHHLAEVLALQYRQREQLAPPGDGELCHRSETLRPQHTVHLDENLIQCLRSDSVCFPELSDHVGHILPGEKR
mmetsp:Transcript_2376/g.4839  ORF Transcript_2376/g.4839 Transcript_2376/m.4839 type:complete len:256 (+) Transcript_2376:518-1285(+)